MKKILLMAALACGAGLTPQGSMAEPARLALSRTLIQTGVLVTRGADTGWERLGGGLSVRPYQYLDPSSPEGWYLGYLGSALSRSAGGVQLADLRLVTLGWRANFFDAGVSPVWGSRIQGSRVLGSSYLGLGLNFGVYVPVFENQDLGFGWEPVIPLAAWGGEAAPNRGYMDFVISWTFKLRTESRVLSWKDEQP